MRCECIHNTMVSLLHYPNCKQCTNSILQFTSITTLDERSGTLHHFNGDAAFNLGSLLHYYQYKHATTTNLILYNQLDKCYVHCGFICNQFGRDLSLCVCHVCKHQIIVGAHVYTCIVSYDLIGRNQSINK